MRVNLDQLIETAGVTPPHNPLHQITLRAFGARNREIARQTRLFKELFCEGDEELLQGEKI